MNIGDLTNNNDNKVHARKGKSYMEFNAKKIFSSLTENSKFTFYCQNQFFALHNFRWNDGISRCTAKVCVIRAMAIKKIHTSCPVFSKTT